MKTNRSLPISKGLMSVLLLLIIQLPARAGEGDSLFSDLAFNGYLKHESAHRINAPRRFSLFRNKLQLETRGAIGERMACFIQLSAFHDAVYARYQDDYTTAVRDEYGSSWTADNPENEIVREVYLDFLTDKLEIRLGKQQVVWGEAIGLRITDVVNSQDYRNFILDDFIDSRIPAWMAKVNYFASGWNIEMLWIPWFEPEREALAGSEWEWTFNAIDAPGQTVRLFDPETPDNTPQNGEAGLRISGLAGGWNISASYLYVWDDAVTRHVSFNPVTRTLDVTRKYHRLPQWGFTFANAFGSFVPRGEFALEKGKYHNTANSSAPEGLVRKDYTHFMLSTDYTRSDVTATLQWVEKTILDYEKGIYEAEVQTSYSLRIQANLKNETLKPELLATFSPTDESWMARPKVAYNYTDTITLTAGADLFAGPERSFFGQFDDNDRITASIKYSF